MRKGVIITVISLVLVGGGVAAWWLINSQQTPASQEPPTQEQAPGPITTIDGECALENGKPVYTYEIKESASIDGAYEIFDDTKEGEKGFLAGGESIFWTTQDPEILISIDDGEKKVVTATNCKSADESSAAPINGTQTGTALASLRGRYA